METVLPIGAGLIAAIAGAGAWAALVVMTGYEIGYIAWGVGIGVGSAIVATGGRGKNLAITAAVLALVGIAGGKFISFQYILHQEAVKVFDSKITQSMYNNVAQAAEDFKNLPSTEYYPKFMAEHHIGTAADTAAGVTAEEAGIFTVDIAPGLQEFGNNPPDFPTWKENKKHAAVARVMSDPENLQGLGSLFGPMDLLFGFLGVSTAFGVVSRAGD